MAEQGFEHRPLFAKFLLILCQLTSVTGTRLKKSVAIINSDIKIEETCKHKENNLLFVSPVKGTIGLKLICFLYSELWFITLKTFNVVSPRSFALCFWIVTSTFASGSWVSSFLRPGGMQRKKNVRECTILQKAKLQPNYGKTPYLLQN